MHLLDKNVKDVIKLTKFQKSYFWVPPLWLNGRVRDFIGGWEAPVQQAIEKADFHKEFSPSKGRISRSLRTIQDKIEGLIEKELGIQWEKYESYDPGICSIEDGGLIELKLHTEKGRGLSLVKTKSITALEIKGPVLSIILGQDSLMVDGLNEYLLPSVYRTIKSAMALSRATGY